MLLCGRVVVVARFPEVSCPQIMQHADCVLEARTFAQLLAMDPFFPDFFLVSCAFGEFDGAIFRSSVE